MKHTFEEAVQLDKNDPFQALTHLFDMPLDEQGKTAIYLNGNSLGPKPKSIDQALMKQCTDWGRLGGRGHLHQENRWVDYNESVVPSLARLTGAKPDEVVAMGTLTANLHFLFASFYRPTRERFKIIRLAGFPSDTYAVASQVKQRYETAQELNGAEPFDLDHAIIEIKPDAKGYIDLDAFKKVLREEGKKTALVWLEAIHYLTGQFFDIPEIVRLARAEGCKIGLDLAHAIGNVPLKLHEWDIDFAVWCNYKYLSAGPGAMGGLFVHEKYLSDPSLLRLAGWWGHNKSTRFKMPSVFDPIPTAEAWQVSNPTVFSLEALRQSLFLFDQVDLALLREKNKRLVSYLERLIHEELDSDIEIITPKNPEERGCQLSLRIKHSTNHLDIEELFFQYGVICDVRGDLVRVAPMGLYTTFVDVFNFADKLKQVCNEIKK